MNELRSETHDWSLTKRIFFRFFFCFFIFQYFLSPTFYVFVFGFNFSVYDWFVNLYAPVYDFVNNHLLHLKHADTRLDVSDFIFNIASISISIVACTLWSIADWQRKSYNHMDFWLRHILKYLLAIIMFSYGIDKLIPDQMWPPGIEELHTPLGNFIPSSLFWLLMGSHSFYESFTGLVELITSLLLIFPRTYVLGLIVLCGALFNVLMLNMSFDIGATYFVIILLITSIYLLFPYLKSIIHFLVNKQPISIHVPPDTIRSKLTKGILTFFASLFILSAFFNTKTTLHSFRKETAFRESIKAFQIKTQINKSDTVRMVEGEKSNWKYWIEYNKRGKRHLEILTMNDTSSYELLLQYDTLQRIVYLRPVEQTQEPTSFTFSYEASKGGDMTLRDSLRKMTLVLKKISEDDWPLLKRRNRILPF